MNQVTSAPPARMKLPLPTNLHTDGHICFYGYAMTTDWFIKFYKTHWEDRPNFDALSHMSATFQYLKAHTHIKTLTFHSALVDQTTPVDYIIDGHRPGEQMVPILSICTSERSSYRKRPSQAQVDTLSRILGGREPRWWIDYELPSSYE